MSFFVFRGCICTYPNPLSRVWITPFKVSQQREEARRLRLQQMRVIVERISATPAADLAQPPDDNKAHVRR